MWFDNSRMSVHYDLICIGCGPAGEKAATQAAYYGKRVAVVEKAPRPGGAMVNTGTLPSKALRETALLCSAFRHRPLPGVEINLDRQLSVPRFMSRTHLLEQQEHDRIERSVDHHGLEVFRGTARLAGPNEVTIDAADGSSRTLESEHILIATGSSPLRPEHIPFEHPCVVDADGVLELDRMPASMAIVGGGVIGCEYACIFAEIGVEVTLINPKAEILPFIDVECRDHLTLAMQKAGVTFLLNDTVKTVTPLGDDRVRVELTKRAPIETNVMLWAAGRKSNSDNLGLEDVGVEMGERGLIVVDHDYRTSVSSIFAAGDVIGFPALASTSMEQGRIAACRMFGIDFKHDLTATMPLGLYTIPAVSSVGLTEAEAREAGHAVVCGRAHYQRNARGRMLGDEQGIVKCVFDRERRELLGVTIVGEQATELIHLAQAVIHAKAGIDYFIDTCFNYPSLSELYKYAAYDALQTIARLHAREAATAPRAKAA